MTTTDQLFQLTVTDLYTYGRPMSQTNKRKIVRLLRKSAAIRVYDRLMTEPIIGHITAHFTSRAAAGAAAYDIETQIGMCRCRIEDWS